LCPCPRRAGSSPGRQQGPAQSFLLLLPSASPGAGESLSTQREGEWRAEGGRECGAGVMAGMCRVTGARQYLLAVLSVSNCELDLITQELGLLFSWSLGLHTRASSPSASALLPPNWCDSHLNKPTCRHLLGKLNATKATLTPTRLLHEECATDEIFSCPPRGQSPPHQEKDFQIYRRKEKFCQWHWFPVLSWEWP